MTEYIRRDLIREYSPLPVFASDQIGGWFVVDSPEYIPRSLSTLCEKRSQRGVTNGSALKTPRPLFRVSPSPCGFFGYVFCAARHACNKRFATMFAYKELLALLRQCPVTYRDTPRGKNTDQNQAIDISVQFNSWIFETVPLMPMKISFISARALLLLLIKSALKQALVTGTMKFYSRIKFLFRKI